MEQIISGIMPENKTDKLCLVASFRKYIEHLHLDNEFLWQYPLDKVNPERPNIWYSRKKLGKNPLATFMSDLSVKCGLLQVYTNHSIRVTGITVLTNQGYSNADIMLVSGHKSVQSLAVYQKTDKDKKILMGKTMALSMKNKEEQKKLMPPKEVQALPQPTSTMQLAVPVCSEMAVTPRPNAEPNIIPFQPHFDDDIPDVDLLSALCEMEETNKNIQQAQNVPVTLSNNTSNVVNQIPKSFFTNCQIGTININLVQK